VAAQPGVLVLSEKEKALAFGTRREAPLGKAAKWSLDADTKERQRVAAAGWPPTFIPDFCVAVGFLLALRLPITRVQRGYGHRVIPGRRRYIFVVRAQMYNADYNGTKPPKKRHYPM